MKDAMASFMVGFRERPEVQDWLAGHGVTAAQQAEPSHQHQRY
jgi:hypothetical protein